MDVKPGYKQTEVGFIPEDWDLAGLLDISEFANGKPHEGNVTSTGRYFLITLDSIGIDGALKPDHKLSGIWDSSLQKDDIVAVLSDIAHGNLLGLCDVIPQNGRYVLNQRMGRLRIKVSADPLFIRHQINRRQDHFKKRGQGTSQRHIYKRDFEALKIPFPNPSEQRAIATALSDVDALITKLDQLIAKKRDIKQASMQQLLTGKTRLPGFSEEWAVKRLDTLATIDPESLSSSTDPAYGFKYISLEDVDKGTLRGYSEQAFDTAPSRARRVLRHSDILISTVRPNLQSHLLFGSGEADWVCSTGFSVVRCLPNVAHPGFVYQQLFAYGISKQIDAILTGSNYPAINSGDVRRLSFPAPGYEEQAAIASVLSDVDAELATLEARRDKTKALKQGMMQVLLTGQVRLPVNKEPMEALA